MRSRPIHAIRRCVRLALPFLALYGVAPAMATDTYRLDPHLGTIEFSVGYFGLFTSHGWFRQFAALFVMDPTAPARIRVDVNVDAASVDMAWQDGAAMLRSADFFDVQHYPVVRFNSTAVEQLSPSDYRLSGLLEMRGVTRPIVLDAKLIGRHPDPSRRADVADFVVTGAIRRSAFGMVANRTFLSDTVDITIRARLQLPSAHAG